MISIGLMSGTSMDGIDAALLKTNGEAYIEELSHFSMAYDSLTKVLLKSAEYAIQRCKGDMERAADFYPQYLEKYLQNELRVPYTEVRLKIETLSTYLRKRSGESLTLEGITQHSTQLHGEVVKNLLQAMQYKTDKIDVIGYHGQTMYHQPSRGVSIIIGDGQILANQTGIRVVNDFRSRDVAAGGQGAPFAPLYHLALAKRDGKISSAVVNCGGIANITLIPDDNPLHLIGFDTGPGNCLIDRLVRQRTSGKEVMDTNGRYGSRGKVDEAVLEALFTQSIVKNRENYLLIPPPKALDVGDLKLIPELNPLSLEDACRTLEAFTAYTIVTSLDLLRFEIPAHWILSGGGWNNPVIALELKRQLALRRREVKVLMADEVGWNNRTMEAQIFAYFAVRSLQGEPFSFPLTTGVPEPLSGGCIYTPHA